MPITTIPVGDLQTNCYIFYTENGDAAIIDPGDEALRLEQYLRMQKLSVKAIWLTHGHLDHIGAAASLRETFGCPIAACVHEKALLCDPVQNLSLAFTGRQLSLMPDILYADGDTFSFGERTVTVLHTPGHTGGSCCYLTDTVLFSGDTLFLQSAGRTDFPTGDPTALRLSLERLTALPDDLAVLPGHGPATRLADEKSRNPYMR